MRVKESPGKQAAFYHPGRVPSVIIIGVMFVSFVVDLNLNLLTRFNVNIVLLCTVIWSFLGYLV